METGASYLLRCRNGDAEAFREFFLLYQRYVFALCVSYVYDREEASDLCQEVFLRVYKNIKKFNETYPVKPWLRRIAVNVCINYSRERARKIEIDCCGDFGDLEEHNGEILGKTQSNPVSCVEVNEELDAIRGALRVLSPKERLAIVLRHQEGLEYQEICQVTGWSLGTVKSLLFRARKILRQCLADKPKMH